MTGPRVGQMGRGSRRRGRRGIALILTLLVLAILIVLCVQLAFTVKVEERIVRNTEDDAALELAARGVPQLVGALFRDDRKNGQPAGAIDALGDAMFDPKTPDARKLQVGQVELELTIEDCERRLPLGWLCDARRAELAEVALRRLIEKLAPCPGDAAAVAKQIAEKVRAVEGVTLPAAGQPAPPPQPGQVATRRLVSLEQLLDEPAADGATPAPAPAPAPGGAAPAAAIDRRFFYGDLKADPPTQGIAGFVTTWPVSGVNLNTALPEVLFALLPEKNKGDEPLWQDADAIVEAIRRKRIDPAFQESGGGGGAAPAPAGGSGAPAGGGQGASRQWSGAAFTKVAELQDQAIHPKLGKIFTRDGTPPVDPAAGGQPGGGQPAQPGQQSAEPASLFELLVIESRFYAVRAKATRLGGADPAAAASTSTEEADAPPSSAFRFVLLRDAQDAATPLSVVEGAAR